MPIALKSLFENHMKSVKDIHRLVPEILEAAQEVYNGWDQSDPDNDDLNGGGICQDIADAISGVLNNHGIDSITVDNNGMGEQHVWCVSQVQEGVYEVDIPPNVYERGGGYTWKKVEGIQFHPDHLSIYRLSVDPRDFQNYEDGY